MSKKIAPEAVLLTALLTMLAGALALAYIDFDATWRVRGSQAICVLLTLILIAGVIVPAKRALARNKAARAEKSSGERSAS